MGANLRCGCGRGVSVNFARPDRPTVSYNLTIFKVTALVVVSIAVFLFADGDPSHFVTPAATAWSPALVASFGMGLVAALWAYKGWES